MNGKQLKNSILQWAIQGKLVPQDPNDEPASVLLERIRAEKARLVKEGKIKKDKNESIIYRGEDNSHYEKFPDGRVVCIDNEIPFEIPAGWEWARLGSIVSNSTGLSYQKELLEEKADSMIRVLRGGNIEDGLWQKKDDDVLIASKYVKPDLLLRKGTFITPAVTSLEQMGKTGLVKTDEESTVVGGFVLMLIPFVLDESLISFLHIVFQTGYYKNYCKQITKKSGQAFYNLSRPLLMSCLIPIPSHKNLRSIVAECEIIRPYIETYGKLQEQLDSLNQCLKTKLRKSVLQEAIQGRLIPQDPTDKSASVLLDLIQTEKRKLLKEGKLKKKDLLESTIFKGDDNKYYEKKGGTVMEISEEIPFEIPNTWRWARLETITYPVGNKCNQIQTKDILKQGAIPVVSQGQSLIDGYSNDNQKTIYDLPLVMFGDHTRNVKFIDFPFVIGADGTKFHKCIIVNPQYLFYWMKATACGLRDRGYARHYSLLRSTPISLPPLKEQELIVEKIRAIAEFI